MQVTIPELSIFQEIYIFGDQEVLGNLRSPKNMFSLSLLETWQLEDFLGLRLVIILEMRTEFIHGETTLLESLQLEIMMQPRNQLR